MSNRLRIEILKYSIKTTTSLCTKIVLESELKKLQIKKEVLIKEKII